MDGFGQRLAQIRKEKKMSQGELAKRMGVSRPSVTQWESGARIPSTYSLNQLSEILDVSIDWLTGKSEEQIIVDKLKSGVPVVEIEADHDFYYKGKKLNPMEKKMFLDMLENMMKLKEIKE